MASTAAFEDAYKKLNPKQKLAVDTVYGPVFVVAGPGTGKTQILTLRIGNILLQASGAKPDEILALTYTDSAVATMRTRLAHFIGSAAYRVRIHTFHGFARSILELRPDLFPRIALGTHLSPVRGIALMEQLLDQGAYTKIRNPKNPHRSAKDLLDFMSKLKQEHYTPEHYLTELTKEHDRVLADPLRTHTTGSHAGKEKGDALRYRERIEKHIEVAELFAAYEKALLQNSLYDYEDLINEAVRGLAEDESFRGEVGERCQFVLADEHQDTNQAQNRLLELITDFDGAPNLFIVGDEKQAIYRFQGASQDSLLYFKDKYPQGLIVSLDENYRSTSAVLDAAHDLIAPTLEASTTLIPVRGTGGTVREVVCTTPTAERDTIRAYIEQLHSSGVSYEDIAILTKKNADVLSLAEALRGAGIPEDHVSVDSSALAHPVVALFISLIRATSDLSNDAPLARALFMPGLPGSLAERVQLLALSREGKSLMTVLLEKGSPDMRSWVRDMQRLAEDLPATPLIPWLTQLAHRSGFQRGLLSLAENEDAYEAYQGFMDEASFIAKETPTATALDFLEYLARIEKHELKIKRPRTRHAGVRLMTVHAAKGLEFLHVIIAHATDEKWVRGKTDEFSLLLEKEEDEDDARRLLYVAVTRAKDTIVITRSETTEEDRAQTPLRFLADLESHLGTATFPPSPVSVTSYENRTVLDPVFLKERLLQQGLSPTGFNNYFASPWQYYFRTLLRLPEAPTSPMLFGTAVHAGLKSYADHLKNGTATIEDALTALRYELTRAPLLQVDKDSLIQLGAEVLHAYLTQQGPAMQDIRESEFLIKTSLAVPGVGDVPLTGKLDRLDIKEDGTVLVIDYKTGKAKSENDIKGLTKNGTGDFYRQLIFYKLLLQKDGRYHMNQGALHFVEPNEKGTIVTRTFTITDAEVHALEQELITASQAIADGSAFSTPCDPTTCTYCDLVAVLTKA
jgi:DNA helicase-2/ATP-dependent DNA helicase PcrA